MYKDLSDYKITKMCESARSRIDRQIRSKIHEIATKFKDDDISYREARILEHKTLVYVSVLIDENFNKEEIE